MMTITIPVLTGYQNYTPMKYSGQVSGRFRHSLTITAGSGLPAGVRRTEEFGHWIKPTKMLRPTGGEAGWIELTRPQPVWLL